MKKASVLFASLILIVSVSILSSCAKKCQHAGTGGSVTLVVFPQHHGMAIPSKTWYLDTVYLKFNTQNSPGTNLSGYDTYVVGEEGEEHVHLENLKCGDYYIYAVGYDSTISKRVTGGIPYSFDKESGEIDLNVPVTE